MPSGTFQTASFAVRPDIPFHNPQSVKGRGLNPIEAEPRPGSWLACAREPSPGNLVKERSEPTHQAPCTTATAKAERDRTLSWPIPFLSSAFLFQRRKAREFCAGRRPYDRSRAAPAPVQLPRQQSCRDS